jgi:hypothetical protein
MLDSGQPYVASTLAGLPGSMAGRSPSTDSPRNNPTA